MMILITSQILLWMGLVVLARVAWNLSRRVSELEDRVAKMLKESYKDPADWWKET